MSEQKQTKSTGQPQPEGRQQPKGELDQAQLDRAAGGMIDVQSAVANFVQGGALPNKKN